MNLFPSYFKYSKFYPRSYFILKSLLIKERVKILEKQEYILDLSI
jgi:hypothetical protein